MTAAQEKSVETDSHGVSVVIDNARLSGFEKMQSIRVTAGTIESITTTDKDRQAATDTDSHEYIDAQGCLAVPGLIDLYTRLREPGFTRKGTIHSETAAAQRAGFTRILCAPDTAPAIDSVATVELIRQRAAANDSACRIIPMAALTIGLQGEHLSELATLQAAGCAVASQADTPLISTTVLYSAMEYAASFDLPLLMTARDAQLGAEGCAHAGAVATRLGLPQIPVAAETVALARLLELCRETGCRIHISRISSARAVQHIDNAKQAGLPVTCDVGIHHLFYTDRLLDGYDSAFHSAVPFRSHADRQALREGIKSGVIDAICSDHAPHDIDASLAPFPETEPGLSAYDWFIPLLLQVPAATGISIDETLQKLHTAPGKLLGKSQSVDIAAGNTADFFLLATDDSPTCKDKLLSNGRNNPLTLHAPEALGLQALTGRVKATITETTLTMYQESARPGQE